MTKEILVKSVYFIFTLMIPLLFQCKPTSPESKRVQLTQDQAAQSSETSSLTLEPNFESEPPVQGEDFYFIGKAPSDIVKIEITVDTWKIGDAPVRNGSFSMKYKFSESGSNRELILKGYGANGMLIDSKEYRLDVQQGTSPQPPEVTEPEGPEIQQELIPEKEDTALDNIPSTEPEAEFIASPNYNSREGTTIDKIVLHNTEGTFDSALTTLRSPSAEVSAHLLLDRDGRMVRLVRDEHKAWHATVANRASLGIEIVAHQGALGMTEIQEKKVLQQIKYWMKKYNIKANNIGIHRWYSSTDCPMRIWPQDSQFKEWRKKHFGV